MDTCATESLLLSDAKPLLEGSLARYPEFYDDVLDEVHARVVERGAATKLDLAALIGWKHVRNAPWMRDLLMTPGVIVHRASAEAFATGLTDAERVGALSPLPGFGAGRAFTSVLLTAWDPSRYGVFDKNVMAKRDRVVSPKCECDWTHLPTFWQHLRRAANEMSGCRQAWSPRTIDMALMNL